jgi:nucleoside-diphosphate-sugar epimerase
MRVLLTGATGFLGCRLAEFLASRHEVHALVRGNVVPPNTHPVRADLELPLATSDWPKTDAVVHLAQSQGYRCFPEGAAAVFSVAGHSTQGLLDYAVRVGARRFILASTGGLYARSGRPLREGDPLDIGRTPLVHYLASKWTGELLAAAYSRLLDVTVLRIFFCYGPGQHREMLMPRLVCSVRDGLPIKLAGKDGLRINPIFVDDAAALVARLVECNGPPVVNIAGPREISLRAVCEIAGRVLGKDPIFESDGTIESPSLLADISRLQAEVSSPLVEPQEGLARLVRSLS